MANVKITKDSNGVRWLELVRNGSGTLLEIRNEQEALQIITALQQSVHPTLLTPCEYCGGSHDKSLGCHEAMLVTQSG